MWVAELRCAQGHGFEGWFASREAFEGQSERGLVSCPRCGSQQLERRLSAPRLNLGAAAPKQPPTQPPTQPPQQPQRQLHHQEPAGSAAPLRELLAHLKAGSEDLGERFADEARRIHRGQAPERAIRGKASGAQFEALLDEGIEVLALPDPDLLSPAH
jgi:hypothetical protein